MCGIFGYIGTDNHAALKAIYALRDLEYRGYDSWGIAVLPSSSGKKTKREASSRKPFFVRKGVGKISDIQEEHFMDKEGAVALGHTRWATHGGVSRLNAHPHFNNDATVAVVHNGIIENANELKKEIVHRLKKDVFVSKTDTEVIPHLIDIYMKRGFSFERAFVAACRRLKGRFAFVAMNAGAPYILAARVGSPLVAGKGDDGIYLASDIPAFLDYTNLVRFFENGEYAKVSQEGITFYNIKTGKLSQKSRFEKTQWSKELATKKGYPHFMLKEIFEQPTCLEDALSFSFPQIKEAAQRFKKANNVFFTACGTAAHMGIIGTYLLSEAGRTSSQLVYASEFAHILPFLNSRSVLCGITQSGETADLLDVLERAKKKRTPVVSFVNVRGSTAERESTLTIPLNAGPEKAVASTKAAASQLLLLAVLAHAIGGKAEEGKKKAHSAVKRIDEWLTPAYSRKIKRIAKRIIEKDNLYVLGKSFNYPIALEAALKIKEVSYIHAEGFAAGELKHGTIALIEKGTPCILLVSNDEYKADMLSAAEELKARGAYIIGIAPERYSIFNSFIKVPEMGMITSLAHMIAAQLFAYHCAVLRGHNPDKPRNLAKSVTVK